MQLVAYAHLNPVVAGLVEDPGDHQHSGHGEVLGLRYLGILARVQVLSMYGANGRGALQSYGAALAALRDEPTDRLRWWPGCLPWWAREVDRPTAAPGLKEWVDEHGRPSREVRPVVDVLSYLSAACVLLDTSIDELKARSANRELARLRYLVVGLGIERWQQKAGELAVVLGRRADYFSWWARRARELRQTDAEWAERYRSLDEGLRAMDSR